MYFMLIAIILVLDTGLLYFKGNYIQESEEQKGHNRILAFFKYMIFHFYYFLTAYTCKMITWTLIVVYFF